MSPPTSASVASGGAVTTWWVITSLIRTAAESTEGRR
jgi:hypothetical protein